MNGNTGKIILVFLLLALAGQILFLLADVSRSLYSLEKRKEEEINQFIEKYRVLMENISVILADYIIEQDSLRIRLTAQTLSEHPEIESAVITRTKVSNNELKEIILADSAAAEESSAAGQTCREDPLPLLFVYKKINERAKAEISALVADLKNIYGEMKKLINNPGPDISKKLDEISLRAGDLTRRINNKLFAVSGEIYTDPSLNSVKPADSYTLLRPIVYYHPAEPDIYCHGFLRIRVLSGEMKSGLENLDAEFNNRLPVILTGSGIQILICIILFFLILGEKK